MEILKGQHKVFIDSDKVGILELQETTTTNEKVYSQFFEQFKLLRTQIASQEKVAPYIVFSDKILVELSDKLPQTKEEMLSISGIGELKYEKYGEKFLNLCRELKPNQKKKLTKTYLDTLNLIEDNKDIDEIVTIRQLQKATIISHIKLLKEYEHLEQIQVDRLIEPLKKDYSKDMKVWIEERLEKYSIEELKSLVYLYEVLFEEERIVE